MSKRKGGTNGGRGRKKRNGTSDMDNLSDFEDEFKSDGSNASGDLNDDDLNPEELPDDGLVS